MNVNDLISRAAKFDEGLAKDIQRFVGGRQFGLVYEESKPEFVRLYNKPVVVGDTVNILPPRGVMENMTSDTDEHEVKWRVVTIADNTAHLKCLESNDEKDVAVDDLVAYVRFDQPIYAGLKEIDRVERGGDKPYQVVINGENFHALESLMFAYQGKVDCIYIDPPYNTGAKDWKYNNNYVALEDVYRHSKWLTFMEDRLRLAKKLLNPQDSVLICTIDEKEYLRLGMLLEQMFPEARIQMISTKINPAVVARAGGFGRSGEYIYYCWIGNAAPARTRLDREWVSNKGRTHTGNVRWDLLKRSGTNAERRHSPGGFYPIYINRQTGKIEKVGDPLPAGISTAEDYNNCFILLPIRDNGTEGNWQWSVSTFKERMSQGRVKIGGNNEHGFTVYILKDGEYGKICNGEFTVIGYGVNNELIVDDIDVENVRAIPGDIWEITSHDSTQYGSRLINKVLCSKRFTFPKSLYAEYDCLRFALANKPEALVIDFFAGSGTTAHATALLNMEDGGSRRSICITNNEVSEEEAEQLSSQNLRQGDAQWEKYGIAHYVTWPRVSCCIKGRGIDGNPLVGNYGVEREGFLLDEDSAIVSKRTGKPLQNRTVYKKVSIQMYPEMDNREMSLGFPENAIFYDIEYLEPSIVQADMAFNEIAPLLWMKAGSRGRIIHHCDKYDISENYAVLFDYRYIGSFTREVQKKTEIKTIFIVTDHDARYRDMCATFPDRNVTQLYEAYLRSFEISCEG